MASKPLARENLSTQLYNNLRSALMEGALAPGERLTIAGIAEEYGTSITPVREAIFRLVSERALEIKEATSVHVPNHSIEKLREIQRIRVELEGYAAYRAAELITPDQLEELKALNSAFIEMAAVDSLQASALNRDFHFAVMKLARMPLLEGVCENMWVLMGPFLRAFHFAKVPVRQPSENHIHYKLLAALEARDPEMSRRAMQDDINWGTEALDKLKAEWAEHNSVAAPKKVKRRSKQGM